MSFSTTDPPRPTGCRLNRLNQMPAEPAEPDARVGEQVKINLGGDPSDEENRP
jgi:hypothetical protein